MVSSERTPNESYAQRAKKASTSPAPRPALQKPPPNAPAVLKPHQVNVWAERIREQKAAAPPPAAPPPRQRASSSPTEPPDDPILPRSPPPDLAILDRQDEHDPFVIRVPLHLSRQSSSSTNPLPAPDSSAWPQAPDLPRNASPAGYDSPFLSAAPSRQNSTASFRNQPGSVHLSRVQLGSLSQHSHSASQSRTQSRSGSSASSPRLQFRAHTLPQDDPLPLDLRLDRPRRSSNKRSSPALPDPPNNISSSFQIDTIPPDSPHYPRPSAPPLQDMPARYTHSLVPQFALSSQFPPTHIPGHTSPPYISPHSGQGQGTPPYPHYPPYPAYMYGQVPIFWSDLSLQNHHFQNYPPVPSNHHSTSERPVIHKMELGSASPAVTAESTQGPGWQPKQSKSVVFGTINVPDSPDNSNASPPDQEMPSDAAVEHATEQLATFSIGLSPGDPGPSRLAGRKSSTRSLSKMIASQTNDGPRHDHDAPPRAQAVNGITKPVKWEFGTTLSMDLSDPPPPSPTLSPLPPLNSQPKSTVDVVDDQPNQVHGPSRDDVSQSNHSAAQSDTGSSASDVWVVKDYGNRFGDYGRGGNMPDVVRWEIRNREKERARENYLEQEMIRDQYRDRGWMPPRQSGWRHENGSEEAREGWEQPGQIDAPRHNRPRRGSFPGYGGHERGGYPGRRGRGRYHNGRGRGGFFHHHRPGSYPYVPQPPPPPPPFELPSRIDIVNGYGQSSYPPTELEAYDTGATVLQPPVQFSPATHSAEAMRPSLLTQLEYYLSPQNMAQDLYLRQRMDDEGWIPISLLASFKRVQQLQTDCDVVKDVLSQSGMFEVSGDWVRMSGRQWEVFVLPNASRSVVTGVHRGGQGHIPGWGPHHAHGDVYGDPGETEGEHGEMEGDCDGDDCEADEEEDDIEFVIGEEAEGSWMPGPERKS